MTDERHERRELTSKLSAGGPPRSHAASPSEPRVVDNCPERVPVTVAELEVIEIWLRSLLDEVLGGGDA